MKLKGANLYPRVCSNPIAELTAQRGLSDLTTKTVPYSRGERGANPLLYSKEVAGGEGGGGGINHDQI